MYLLIFTVTFVCAVAQALESQTLSSWYGLRAGLIRDRIYVEGGLATNGTYSSGRWENISYLDDQTGLLMTLDMKTAFSASDYVHAMRFIDSMSPNTYAAQYVNGAMFSTNEGFTVFG